MSTTAVRPGWMQTFTGRAFYPAEPRLGDIDIVDIAHGLSNLCRYNGAVSRFYCPTPEQRVLTADLRWVPAGDLHVGDELLGFDEEPWQPGQSGGKRRRFRHSTVLTAVPVRRRVIRLEMSDGSSVRSSAEHPWLVSTKQSGNRSWLTTESIAAALAAGRRRFMHKYMEPWATDSSWDAGWLAGILDGEGHISFLRRGVQFGVAQRPGLVHKEIEAGFARLGFTHYARAVGKSDVQSLQVYGGWRALARLLGTVRPVRLLDKFTEGLRAGELDKQMNAEGPPLEIVAAYSEGEDWVAGLETSSRTYLCEGYGAHNSVAEHCVLMSTKVAPEHALWALLHDATEAYIGDMISPLKQAFPEFRKLEDDLMCAIAMRFGLPSFDMPAEVKQADLRILLDERAALLTTPPQAWMDEIEAMEPLGVPIHGWEPAAAEQRFLDRFTELRCPW